MSRTTTLSMCRSGGLSLVTSEVCQGGRCADSPLPQYPGIRPRTVTAGLRIAACPAGLAATARPHPVVTFHGAWPPGIRRPPPGHIWRVTSTGLGPRETPTRPPVSVNLGALWVLRRVTSGDGDG